jgi:polyisoprenoid-binding protein YceI
MSGPATSQTSTTTWNIDTTHPVVEFKVKHITGHFAKVTGVLTLDESELKNSRVEAMIEAASIETQDTQRDMHLKSADFFDIKKFPNLSFKSTGISLVQTET